MNNSPMPKGIAELFEVAKAAAVIGAEVHKCVLKKGTNLHTTKQSSYDLVTEVDREAERQLVDVIHRARPHDSIIGEEGTTLSGETDVCWVLDPLDGTTNFVHRYPPHSVAVGVEINGKRSLGVVYDTFNERIFSASLAPEQSAIKGRLVFETSRN